MAGGKAAEEGSRAPASTLRTSPERSANWKRRLRELRQAVETGRGVEEELGDVLFAAVKVGRFAGVDPETAIASTCEKFIHRFRAVENGAQGRPLETLTPEEMTELWNRAKRF